MVHKAEDASDLALHRSLPASALEGQIVLQILDRIKMKCIPGGKKERRQTWGDEKEERCRKKEKERWKEKCKETVGGERPLSAGPVRPTAQGLSIWIAPLLLRKSCDLVKVTDS